MKASYIIDRRYFKNPLRITTTSGLLVNNTYEGETIEQKIERITVNKEPITDGAPITYTERKDGVKPEYDIRTDKWDIAVDAMGVIDKTHKTKRADYIKAKAEGRINPDGTIKAPEPPAPTA